MPAAIDPDRSFMSDSERDWIAKYRAALDRAPVQPPILARVRAELDATLRIVKQNSRALFHFEKLVGVQDLVQQCDSAGMFFVTIVRRVFLSRSRGF